MKAPAELIEMPLQRLGPRAGWAMVLVTVLAAARFRKWWQRHLWVW